MTAVDMNLSIDQALPSESKYLTKNDVITPVIATIRSFQYEELTAGEGEKLIMLFDNNVKPLVLNVTNKNRLISAYPDVQGMGGYKGKQVKLFFDANVEYSGRTVGGIRIDAGYKPESAEPISEKDAMIAAFDAVPDPNDDIPF